MVSLFKVHWRFWEVRVGRKIDEEATRRADDCAQQANRIAEAESEYRAKLDQEMARLEKFNPVGPRAGAPLISGDRLAKEIEAGKPLWQARREHRARERAARHRQGQAAELRSQMTKEPGPLRDVDPAEGGQALDGEMNRRAKEELRAFRKELREDKESSYKTVVSFFNVVVQNDHVQPWVWDLRQPASTWNVAANPQCWIPLPVKLIDDN